MRYAEFESEFPDFLKSVTPVVRRQWKKRDKVPASAVTEARTAANVTPLPVTSETVTPPTCDKAVKRTDPVTEFLSVAIPSAEGGHPEFDIMSDGYARGFPGDAWQRVNRTCHAIRRMAERTCGLGTDDATALAKTMIAEWEKVRVDCPAGEDGNVCRVSVLERIEKMDKPDKKFAVHSGVGR